MRPSSALLHPVRLSPARCAVLALAGCSAFWAVQLRAEPPATASSVPGAAAATSQAGMEGRTDICVTVDVAGNKVGAVDCVAKRLQEAARIAQTRASGDPTLAVPDARSRALTVGIGSVEASSQRLGRSLRGATALPQRQLPPPPMPGIPRK